MCMPVCVRCVCVCYLSDLHVRVPSDECPGVYEGVVAGLLGRGDDVQH